MIHILTSLRASDTYNIQLFPTECISGCTAVLLGTLIPYSNWCDHSIIIELVGACDCPEAERVLDEFDSTLLVTYSSLLLYNDPQQVKYPHCDGCGVH